MTPDPLGPDALFDGTSALTSIGPRQLATPGEEAARDVVLAGLQPLNPVAEPFTVEAWLPGTATITVGTESRAVEALSPTPATDLVAPLADEAVGGALAVLSSDDGTRAESFVAAIAGGAAALVRVTEELDFDGSALVEVGHLLDGSTFPAVAVDRATGDWLRGHLGASAHLVVAPQIVPGHTSANVVARIAADHADAQHLFVVAHYDSWHPSESAFDNALGTDGLLLLAQAAAAKAAPNMEIVFIATSAEEQGLKGANAWAAAHEDEIGPGDLVLVLDVMWSGEGRYLALATTDALRDEAVAATEAVGLPAIEGGNPGLGSDHVPFVLRGADAIWIGRWPDRHYHTVADTIDALDFEAAALALKANWRILAHHAGWTP